VVRQNNPAFAAKAAEIIGLYMAPPDNAIVLAVVPPKRHSTHCE
jgi:hypothetical protein